jgi:hypothetical protein
MLCFILVVYLFNVIRYVYIYAYMHVLYDLADLSLEIAIASLYRKYQVFLRFN